MEFDAACDKVLVQYGDKCFFADDLSDGCRYREIRVYYNRAGVMVRAEIINPLKEYTGQSVGLSRYDESDDPSGYWSEG